MRLILILPLAGIAGCATAVELPADRQAYFDPISFFEGGTQGTGRLQRIFASPERLQVESSGRRSKDGELQLTQRIQHGEKPARTRVWTIRRVSTGHYTGTLTEAVGPVEVRTAGPRATVRYAMKGGITVRQQLALQPGGRTLLNHLEVRKWGVRVAKLEETIRKLP